MDIRRYIITSVYVVMLIVGIFLCACNQEKNIEKCSEKARKFNIQFGKEVKEQYCDLHVIPDRVNTGLINPEECIITLEHGKHYPQYQNIHFRQDHTDSMYIDLGYIDYRVLEGEIIFENVDFKKTHSNKTGVLNCNYYSGEGLTIKYKNCRFPIWYVRDFDTENVSVFFEFENCEFLGITGCNITMKNCYVGGGDFDAMNPGKNFYCYDTYIADICHKTKTQGATHLDGMQSLFCQNMYFDNCRWEVPDIAYSVNAGGFSYAVYLEPIRGHIGKDCIFEHCYINGGGYYSISCTARAHPVDNIRIIEPFIGACYRGAPFYPPKYGNGNQGKKVTENPRFHDSLYVSSVWIDDDGILHFLVTNDTLEERTLVVYTENGIKEFFIPGVYKYGEYPIDSIGFEDYPFDIEFKIQEETPEYVIFYEQGRQIRFENFTEEKVYEPYFKKKIKNKKSFLNK